MADTPGTSPAPGPLRRPLLSVRRLVLAYGALRVLNGVDFDVWPGQLVALTGENGAGKSSLVRCIAGDIAATAGEVTVDGTRLRSNAQAASNGVAVVWQDAALCDNLDVSANLFLGREPGRWFLSRSKAAAKASTVLASYGIRLPGVATVRELSGGQRQLLAVARAMQRQPRLLVLDEPTASLGVQETLQVEALIGELRQRGTTVFLISHDVDQVFQLADRILVLRRGKVAADLAPSETHPEDVVAIMSGHAPDGSARHQLTRLQNLVDKLASATASSSLPLIISALASALSTEHLCIHLMEDQSLRLVAAEGFPSQLLEAWASLPAGVGGGPMGIVAETGRTVIDEDIHASEAWRPYARLGSKAGIRSSWAVPLIGSSGLIGVITGCQPVVGHPERDQIDLVSLYAGYAAGAIERDRLFGEVTRRNRVLETIREVLEVLAGPEPVASGLRHALKSLQRGLRASEIELWVRPSDGPARCSAFVGPDDEAEPGPLTGDGAAALRALSLPPTFGAPLTVGHEGSGSVIATTFEAPGGRAALVAHWSAGAVPDDATALIADAAHSVRLALERDEAEQAHQQAAALRRSHQLQRDFLSRLSHELRTPLTAIRGYASSLLAPDVTWDDESKLRFLNRIAGESARLGRLVGDLLDFSAIESGLLRLQQDWCDPALVIEAAIACLPPERSVAISVDCPPSVGPIWADHDRLEQVFVNLLDNAQRHNAGDVKVQVQVALAEPNSVAIRVADDGGGIPEELRGRLFEPQARGVTSAPGAGLGLSIARGVVMAHGGHIRLEEVPRGASFLIVLPVEGPEGSAS